MNNRISTAISALQQGKMILLTDHPDREDEADLIIAAQYATGETINFMSKHARGLICLALTPEQVDRLNLPMMVKDNRATFSTPFTVSIDAAHGVRGGISAYERALTIKLAIDPYCAPADLVSPGHIFPLRAHPQGLAGRQGHTEASIFLAERAGCMPAAVICEVLAEDGHMLRGKALEEFAAQHQIPILSITEILQQEDIASLAETNDLQLQKVATSHLPTAQGNWLFSVWRQPELGEFSVLQCGDLQNDPQPLVRIHSACLTGDVFGSLRCDCGSQLSLAMEKIASDGCGAIIYLPQEGRGIGLANKIRAYALQEQGHNTVSANVALGLPVDARKYDGLYALLNQLHIKKMRLLTNNPQKLAAMKNYLGEQEVVAVALKGEICRANVAYLQTKRELLGHLLEMPVNSLDLAWEA